MKRLAAVILTMLVAVMISGAGGSPAVSAAEGKIWRAVETYFEPDGGYLSYDTASGGQITIAASLDSIVRIHSEPAQPQRTGVYGIVSPATPAWTLTQEFTFTPLPDVLTPGEVFTITVTGHVTITGSAEHADSIAKRANLIMSVGKFDSVKLTSRYDWWQDGSGEQIMKVNYGEPPLTQKYSFTVPSDMSPETSITLWLYGAGGDVHRIYKSDQETGGGLTMTHFHPFDYFKAFTGTSISPAGDILAVLKDGDGKPLNDQLIIFYVDPETASETEPGHNLHKVMDTRTVPYALRGAPPGRIYLNWNHTNAFGEARINYLGQIDTREFANELVHQDLRFGDQEMKPGYSGRISGEIRAGVYNEKTQTLETTASVGVEYFGVAKLLSVTGAGRPDDTETGRKYPGRVRVKRVDSGFIPREEGYIFMPWDIVDIDGNCAVEIAFVNGDKVIARVPDIIRIGAVREPYEPPESQIIVMGSAYDSGFPSRLERATGIGWGFGVKKAIEVMVETVAGGLVKEGVELVVEIYDGMDDIDLGDVDIVARTRIRSKVLIDNTGDELKIYNIEGSPSIKTAAGGETAPAEGKYVAVSDAGALRAAQPFDAAAVESEFYGRAPAITANEAVPPEGAKKESSGLLFAGLGAAAVVLAVLGVMVLRKRRPASAGVYGGYSAPGGQPVTPAAPAFCPGCGKPNTRRAPFCGGCGKKLL